MDQSVELNAGNRRLAAERLRDFIVTSVDAATASDTPFYHLVLDRVFPDDVYAAMLANMPDATDYRPMHGRSKGHDLADGTHTRVKIDLFPRIYPPPAAAEARGLGHRRPRAVLGAGARCIHPAA